MFVPYRCNGLIVFAERVFLEDKERYVCRWTVCQQFWDITRTKVGYCGSILTKKDKIDLT